MFPACSCSKKRNPDGDPGAGPLLTLLQFVLITLLSLPNVVAWEVRVEFRRCGNRAATCRVIQPCVRAPVQPRRFFLKKTVIPLKHYVLQAALFFSMSYLNNVAFEYHISQPVHMVVRSSNLVITCLLGLVLGKKCVACVRAAAVW